MPTSAYVIPASCSGVVMSFLHEWWEVVDSTIVCHDGEPILLSVVPEIDRVVDRPSLLNLPCPNFYSFMGFPRTSDHQITRT